MDKTFTDVSCISVMVVDDHPLVLAGIKALLQPETDIRVLAEADSGAKALQMLAEHPDIQVALLDLNMPHMTGIELARLIRQRHPQVKALVLSTFQDHASVAEVLEAGGTGYLLKSTTRQELGTAIRAVAAGQRYFSQEVTATMVQSLEIQAGHSSQRVEKPASLTSRESEILQLIAQEYSNERIAQQLFISERTVESHRKNILTKTKSKTIIGLIRYALRNKLIT
ncbi:response regulator transcription factor [Hymenobacter metallicola]|uniref:Response regulator transcription factor n=1 Tax=Hymenobacter metallicola TaxID=2563114 RepID=A0A4Z0QLE2_9BACT|nr:response regulator transcription factor [Hymenobacter metallicola]TGE29562.1 response regulator transcription factor [Hymenobacter metallicola]